MTATPHTLETAIELMKIFNGFFGPDTSELWWRTDGEYAPVTLLINCNDLFYWGMADCETITPEDIPDLKQAVADITFEGEYHHAHLLWVCRKRQQRPQTAYYKHFNDHEKTLFDACGTEEDQYGTAAYERKSGEINEHLTEMQGNQHDVDWTEVPIGYAELPSEHDLSNPEEGWIKTKPQ